MNRITCLVEIVSLVRKTVHIMPSEHGGVVKLPLYLK